MENPHYELILKKFTNEQREVLLLRKAGFSYNEIIEILAKNGVHLTIKKIKKLIKTTVCVIIKEDPSITPQHSVNELGINLAEKEQYDFKIIESFLHKLPVLTAPEGLQKRINDIFNQ